MDARWDLAWIGGRIATMHAGKEPLEDAVVAIAGDRIAWVGTRRDVAERELARCPDVRDAEGRWITPGLVDCHTHLVHAGNRAWEFERRLSGVSYAEIARAGGGILSSVRATRAADEATLVAETLPRLAPLLREGVTTVEIKSGYGLERETELRQLRAARRIAATRPVDVRTSFLGAHAVPPEYAGRADAYVDLLCDEILPAAVAEGLVDAVDGFCETIAFTPAQIDRLFGRARSLGLPVKLHAEQLSDQGGAALVARHGGLSADHLEYLSEEGVAAMARAGTVAVLLPGAFYMLRETKLPPVEALRRAGVPLAVATDANPGTSPIFSLLAIANMACTLFRLTVEEALAGITREGARALGLLHDRGTIEPGKRADLVLWPVGSLAELVYEIGRDHRPEVVFGGRPRPAHP